MSRSSNRTHSEGPTGLPQVGAHPIGGQAWEFLIWAPRPQELQLHLEGGALIEMRRNGGGYHSARVENLPPDQRYRFRLADGRELPDPASRFQPEGIFGPSQTVDLSDFNWTDSGWRGHALEESVFYELHVGTYTPEGTFDAVIPHLSELAQLGITTIELMPVAQFPGKRDWGYDGVLPYAPQDSYGGPRGLQRLVDAAHAARLSVAMDVVYNHLGPEGNYLGEWGPYFTKKYGTPWGEALNFDDADSEPVRWFFIHNALMWIEQYHMDALRLDAIHGIFDFSAHHFLAELAQAVKPLEHRLARRIQVIAESDFNDVTVLHPRECGGYQLDAQWSDDFHHSVHTLLTHEAAGYYEDFGSVADLARTLRDGWCYSGQYSRYRRRRHGNSAKGVPRSRFLVCTQNHDQVGNRPQGERLSALVGFEALKLAAGATLLSPFVPLLFMGEEYGETAPFQFFTSYDNPELIEAVRIGRRKDLASMGWHGEAADPEDDAPFARSHLQHDLKTQPPHSLLESFYARLMEFRREHGLGHPGEIDVREEERSQSLEVVRHSVSGSAAAKLAMIFHFGSARESLEISLPAGGWKRVIDSASADWAGPGSTLPASFETDGNLRLEMQPQSFVVLEQAAAEGRG